MFSSERHESARWLWQGNAKIIDFSAVRCDATLSLVILIWKEEEANQPPPRFPLSLVFEEENIIRNRGRFNDRMDA